MSIIWLLAMDETHQARKRLITMAFRVGLGLVAGAIFVALVVQEVHLYEVKALLQRATLAPLLLALVVFVADFLLRAVRFWLMLGHSSGRRLALHRTIAPFIASFGMSDLLPLRLGDGFRVVWFSQHFRIPTGTVIGTMIVERILDLVTIAILGGIALALVDADIPSGLIGNFQLVLVTAITAGFALLFLPALMVASLEGVERRFGWSVLARILSPLKAVSAAVLHIGSFGRIAMLAAMSLVLWAFESLVLVGAWLSLGGAADAFLKPLLAFTFSTIGTLVPSLPGHFGAFEYFGVQAFTLVGVEAPEAVAVVLLAHLILWAPTAIFAICWLLLGARSSVRRPT